MPPVPKIRPQTGCLGPSIPTRCAGDKPVAFRFFSSGRQSRCRAASKAPTPLSGGEAPSLFPLKKKSGFTAPRFALSSHRKETQPGHQLLENNPKKNTSQTSAPQKAAAAPDPSIGLEGRQLPRDGDGGGGNNAWTRQPKKAQLRSFKDQRQIV